VLRRVPLPLALILAVAAVAAATWSLVIPALQGPDEVSHFSYVQKIVDAHEIPWKPAGAGDSAGGSAYSGEVSTALVQAGLGPLAANIGARPLWTRPDEQIWERSDSALSHAQRTNGGFTSAFKNPPLYYVYQAIPYALASKGSFFDRLFVMRLANIPLLLTALVLVWLIAGELAGRGWPQVLATAACSLVPQVSNLAATVNPDLALMGIWSAAIYVMILLLRRGPRTAWIVELAALCLAGALTHVRSLPIFLPALAAVLLSVMRARGRHLRPAIVCCGLAVIYAAGLFIASGVGKGSVRQFGSYVWQFYLPKVSSMTPKIGPEHFGFREAWVERLYGTLAQLEVTLPPETATWLFRLTIAGLVALVIALVVQRASVRRESAVAWVLVLAIGSLLLGLHYAAYRSMLTLPGDPIVTARYLLPLISLFGAAVALVAKALPRRAAGVFAGLLLVVGVALQLGSIGLLVERFYA
jgi:4-amino-4-deoxy-L-arabinose transferase-like glycosyltransferase